ncbi:MAG: hypothetical protein ACW99Q_02500 [Candidatus Kariarchaeaceae archaeon]
MSKSDKETIKEILDIHEHRTMLRRVKRIMRLKALEKKRKQEANRAIFIPKIF